MVSARFLSGFCRVSARKKGAKVLKEKDLGVYLSPSPQV